VSALAKDVEYLAEFVDSLGVPILRENLDELQQTVHLMQAENGDEFYDISTRNKKYGRVDAMNGPILLEKYAPTPRPDEKGRTDLLTRRCPRLTRTVQGPTKTDKFSALSRFGMK
jgi:hypothetical protein